MITVGSASFTATLNFYAGNAPWLMPILKHLLKNSKRMKAFRVLYDTSNQLIQQRRAEPEAGKVYMVK